MKFNFPFAWYNKFGTIPETYKEAMSYEEQILWLCKHQEDIEKNVTIDIEALRTEFENALESLDNEKQDKLIAGDNIEIDGNVISSFYGTNLTPDLTENLYFGDYNIGDEFPSVAFTFDGMSAIIINGVTKPTTFKIKGDYTIYEINPSTNIIIGKDKSLVTSTYASYTSQGNTDVAVQFAQIETYPPKLIQENSFESNELITTLSSDLDVTNGLPNIDEGVYYTGNHIVKEYDETWQSYVSLIPENTLFVYSRTYATLEPIYYLSSPDDLRRFFTFDSVNQKWHLTNYGVDRQIDSSSTDVEIPSSKAVYDFVSAFPSSPITTLTENVLLIDGATPFSEGLYYTGNYAVVNTNSVNMIENNTLFYYNATSNEMLTIYEKEFNTKLGERVWYYIESTNRWSSNQFSVLPYISASSENDEIPTSKAVYEYIAGLPTSPITTFTENITLTNATTPFTTGLYYTGSYTLSYNTTTMLGNDILFYYSGTDNKIIKINKPVSSVTSSELFSDYWGWVQTQYIQAWQHRTMGLDVIVSSSSTNTGVPTSLAVYRAIQNFVNGNGNSSSVVNTIWTGTETEYNALTPDSNTLYFIKE